MRLMLLNGVYGATEHFDSLREALAPTIETHVFPLRRDGLPNPSRGTRFDPMVERLHGALTSYADPSTGASAGAGTAKFHVLGFSLGGTLALEYALAHPGRISSLILVNSFGRYEQGPLQAASAPVLHGVPPAWTHPSLTARIVHGFSWMRRGLFHPEAPLEAIRRGVQAAITEVTQEDVRFQLAHLGLGTPDGYEARLAALAQVIPILLVSSRDDAVVSPRHTEWLALTMPTATRAPSFEGGHAFFQHDARKLAELVKEFLSRTRHEAA